VDCAAGVVGFLRAGLQERGLADAGLAVDQRRASVAGGQVGDPAGQLAQLGVPAHQGRSAGE
jgi:hypothetical protein